MMAEVDMELDISARVGLEDSIDEDLIDYESEAEAMTYDQHSMLLDSKDDVDVDVDVADHQMQDDLPDDVDAMVQYDELVGAAEAQENHTEMIDSKINMSLTQGPSPESLGVMDRAALEPDDNLMPEDGDLEKPTSDEQAYADLEQEGQQLLELEDANAHANAEPEISYEQIDAPPQETTILPNAKSTNEEPTVLLDNTAPTTNPKADETTSAAEEVEAAELDEITWEEASETDQEPSKAAGTHEERGGEVGDSHQEQETEEEPHPDQSYDDPDPANQEPVVDDGAEAREYADEALQEEPQPQNDPEEDETQNNDKPDDVNELSVDYHTDSLPAQHNEAAPGEFPSITVHYRGEDYSLLSEGVDGFFSDAGVLDYTMATLLSSFRTELQSEIEPQDDLVLQIDELGLEFTEAQSSSILPNLTFRQILEVFDMLVKNQDPEVTKTLYTYLTTKPNVGKRYEFLVESATDGTGLEEISHFFEPTTAAFSLPATVEATDDGQDPELDGEAAGDSGNVNEEITAEEEDEENEEEEIPVENGPDDAEEQIDGEQHDVNRSGDLNDGAMNHRIYEEQDPAQDTSNTPIVEENNVEREIASEHEGAIEDHVEVDHSFSKGAENNYEEDEAGLGLDLRVDDDPDEIDFEGTAEEHHDTDALDEEVTLIEPDQPSKFHTYQDENDAGFSYPAGDEKTSTSGSHTVGEPEDEVEEEDELAEIDWRDEPEVVSKPEVAPTAAGEKRDRDDEGPEVEEEQGVKRRRA